MIKKIKLKAGEMQLFNCNNTIKLILSLIIFCKIYLNFINFQVFFIMLNKYLEMYDDNDEM